MDTVVRSLQFIHLFTYFDNEVIVRPSWSTRERSTLVGAGNIEQADSMNRVRLQHTRKCLYRGNRVAQLSKRILLETTA